MDGGDAEGSGFEEGGLGRGSVERFGGGNVDGGVGRESHFLNLFFCYVS